MEFFCSTYNNFHHERKKNDAETDFVHRIFPRGWPRYKKKKKKDHHDFCSTRKRSSTLLAVSWNKSCNGIATTPTIIDRVGGKRGSSNSKFSSVRFETDAMIKRGEDKATEVHLGQGSRKGSPREVEDKFCNRIEHTTGVSIIDVVIVTTDFVPL